jgi:hypothetical protein
VKIKQFASALMMLSVFILNGQTKDPDSGGRFNFGVMDI